MIEMFASKVGEKTAIITPLSAKRDWMDENFYSYNCFPISVANKLGWGISFDKDISFIWNGRSAVGPDGGITVLEGEEYCYFDRGGGVIGFKTEIVFETDPGVELLTMPVPNQLIDGAQCLTTILNTSMYTGALHVAWRVTRPDHVITIKAGTPVGAIIPITPLQFQDSKITFLSTMKKPVVHGKDYVEALTKYGYDHGKTANWYREAIDENGNSIGSHSVKNFKFHVE